MSQSLTLVPKLGRDRKHLQVCMCRLQNARLPRLYMSSPVLIEEAEKRLLVAAIEGVFYVLLLYRLIPHGNVVVKFRAEGSTHATCCVKNRQSRIARREKRCTLHHFMTGSKTSLTSIACMVSYNVREPVPIHAADTWGVARACKV